jgi:hypothetical protein
MTESPCRRHPDYDQRFPPSGSCQRCWRLFAHYSIFELSLLRRENDAYNTRVAWLENRISDLENALFSANESRARMSAKIYSLRGELDDN